VLLFLLFTPRAVKSWHIGAFATLLLTTAVAGAAGTNLTVISALLAPGLALLAGDLALESFELDLAKLRKWLFALPPLLTSALIVVTVGLGLTESFGVPASDNVRMATGAILAVLLIFTTLRRLPRWSFALLFIAGVWFGSFLWPHTELLPTGSQPVSSQIWWILLPVAIVAGDAAYYLYYGRAIPKRALTDGGFRFGREDFRRFDNQNWEGKTAPLSDGATEPFSFVIFGDVTGAESPVAGRHGGYFAFRSLTERMKQIAPRFAISLGDLATQATAHSFRRLRKLLRSVPVPMMAIPGNHDLFRRTHYDARYFQSLFGADHCTFRLGPVQFVLINNASGAFEEQQFAWLEETLHTSDAPFLLVFCHKPIFDLRPTGSYAMELRDEAERLHDLFRANEVTAVFSGHIHALLSETRDGVKYIISGGGGSRLASSDDVHHYLSVDIAPETLAVRALPVERGTTDAPLLQLHFSPRSCSFTDAASSPTRSAS
jgi:predicted phosphodiesterase